MYVTEQAKEQILRHLIKVWQTLKTHKIYWNFGKSNAILVVFNNLIKLLPRLSIGKYMWATARFNSYLLLLRLEFSTFLWKNIVCKGAKCSSSNNIKTYYLFYHKMCHQKINILEEYTKITLLMVLQLQAFMSIKNCLFQMWFLKLWYLMTK